MKNGFTIIGTMIINKDNNSLISKALMNRFVAIYLDDYLEFNNNNLEIIIDNTIQKLNKEINESLQNIKQNKNLDLNKSNDSNDEDDNDDSSDSSDYYSVKFKIHDWFSIKSISNETIKILNLFLKKKNAP